MKQLSTFVAVVVVLSGLSVAVVPTGTGQTGIAQPAMQERCSFPFTATDVTGTEVTIEAEPTRVVVLQPSAAQTMWEIGAQEKVVGMPVGPYTAYLNGSKERTSIVKKDGYTVNVEKVIALQPDLVLAPNIASNETVRTLRNAGLTVYKFSFGTSIEDIYAKTKLMGRLVGECQGATQRVEEMKATVSAIKSAVEGRDEPRVFYWMGGGYTAGKGTFIHEIIETAGGENIAANANITGYAKISAETVIKQNPQWIIVGNNGPPLPNGTVYGETIAMKKNQIIVVNSNYISQPAPRVVRPIQKLARAFHPEAFEQENATTGTTTNSPPATETTATTQGDSGTMTETATPKQTATPKPTTETSGPGFGAIGAALALVAAALFAQRRW